MKPIFPVTLALVASILLPIQAQSDPASHFYNPQAPISVSGIVEAVTLAEIYEKNSLFIVITVQTKAGKQFRIEIGPRWFFQSDLVKGMAIKIEGALVANDGAGEPDYIIAREIIFQGEKLVLRDSRGFPMWARGRGRGGRGQGRGGG